MIRNVIIICILLIISAFQQESKDNKIWWTKDRKLTWDNFNASPDNNNKDGARTYSGYSCDPYTIKKSSDSITLVIKCYFNKNTSWVKEYAKTDLVLKHEQCHFDITELNARKFRKLISTYKFSKITFDQVFKSLFDSSHKEWFADQDFYDKETNHSRNETKQLEWEKTVVQGLKDLDSYSGTTLVVYFSK